LEEAINIKLVVLGEGGVGKTSLVNTFLGEKRPREYLPTIGYNINHKDYVLSNVRVKVNIWDIGGQRGYNVFNPAVYNNVNAAFLVFDLSQPEETLKSLKIEHIKNLENYAEEEEEAILFIVGNKLDLVLVNKNLEPIKDYLSDDDLIVATSAKTDENVEDSFHLLIYTYLKQTKRDKIANEFIKTIGKTEKQLVSQLIDLSAVDILLLKEKVKPTTIKKDTVSIEAEESKFIYYHDFQKDLEKTDLVRDSLFEKFYSTLTEIEEAVKTLKKSPQKTIGASIDDLGDHLIVIGNDLESDLKYLSDLKKDENIVIDRFVEITAIEVEGEKPKIIAKEKEVKIEAKPKREIIEINKIEEIEQIMEKELVKEVIIEENIIKEIIVSEPPSEIIVKKEPKKEKVKITSPEPPSKEDLHQIYEKDNPGKKAIWRGKVTKGFLEWKEKYIETKKEKLGSAITKSDMIEVQSKEDLDIISEKIKSDLIIEDKEENLHSTYEEENPGKKAIWRGKVTKGFLEWKENYLKR